MALPEGLATDITIGVTGFFVKKGRVLDRMESKIEFWINSQYKMKATYSGVSVKNIRD